MVAGPTSGARAQSPPGLVEVLDYVRRHDACTRAELVEATGLGRAVVGQRLAALAEHGLVEESGVGPSTGGRAPRRVRFRAAAGHVLAADIGATSVDVAVADLAGAILVHDAEPADVAAGPEAVLGRVEALLDECLDRADAPGPLLGIGIGVPGPVEFHAGRPISPPIMPGWDGYDVPERFARHGVRVWVDNDVNVMALGGELYRGGEGCAGDIGLIEVAIRCRDDVVCRCGNVNCLEALAGGAAL